LEPGSEVPVQSVIKWFDAEKGFGFVELSDGTGCAFLHVSVLVRSGIHVVQPGDVLRILIGPGHQGPHVTEVLNIRSTSATSAAGPQTISRIVRPSRASSAKERGTVTSYNVKRGYGFISRDQGGSDAYVETSTLGRCGIRKLSKGQRVIVRVVERERGPKAVWLRLIGPGWKQREC
jgi:CspA family cold shock protein